METKTHISYNVASTFFIVTWHFMQLLFQKPFTASFAQQKLLLQETVCYHFICWVKGGRFCCIHVEISLHLQSKCQDKPPLFTTSKMWLCMGHQDKSILSLPLFADSLPGATGRCFLESSLQERGKCAILWAGSIFHALEVVRAVIGTTPCEVLQPRADIASREIINLTTFSSNLAGGTQNSLNTARWGHCLVYNWSKSLWGLQQTNWMCNAKIWVIYESIPSRAHSKLEQLASDCVVDKSLMPVSAVSWL